MPKIGDILMDGHVVGEIRAALRDKADVLAMATPNFGQDEPDVPDDSTYSALGNAQVPVYGRDRTSPPRWPSSSKSSPSKPPDTPTFRPGLTPRGKAAPALPKHISVEDVHKAVTGEHDDETGQPKLTGSAYLAAERKSAKDEVDADPAFRRFLRGVIVHEQSAGQRVRVFEALLNRYNAYKQSHPGISFHEYMATQGRAFYGPIRRGEINENYLRGVDKYAASVDKEMDEAFGGSNYVKGFSDQGSRGDPNFGREMATGEYVYSNGELYGDQTPAQRRYRLDQQRRVQEGGTVPIPGQAESQTVPRAEQYPTRLGAEPPPAGTEWGVRHPGEQIPEIVIHGVKPIFPVAPGVNVSGMNPEFIARMNAAYRAAAAAGQPFTVISGYRPTTRAEARALGMSERSSQEDIWERSAHGTRFPAAPPGRSRHQAGEAADVSGPGVEWMIRHRHEYGLEEANVRRGPSYDPGHSQLARSYQGPSFAARERALTWRRDAAIHEAFRQAARSSSNENK